MADSKNTRPPDLNRLPMDPADAPTEEFEEGDEHKDKVEDEPPRHRPMRGSEATETVKR